MGENRNTASVSSDLKALYKSVIIIIIIIRIRSANFYSNVPHFRSNYGSIIWDMTTGQTDIDKQ